MHEQAGDLWFLPQVMVFLVAAVLVVPAARRLGASPVLGYLAAGALIGPSGLALVVEGGVTRGLAELGVVFLLFTIGLELSFERLKVMRRFVFGLGAAQVLASGLVLGTAAYAFGIGINAATVVGFSLALSSTAIVLQILVERNELAGKAGRVAFAVLLFQDLAVVPLLVLISLLAAPEASFWQSVAFAAGKAALAIGLIVVVGRLLVGPLFQLIAASRSREVFLAVSLLAVIATASATSLAGLPMALGAFLAGLLLAGTAYRHQVAADIEPFKGLLLGLFFITVGMEIDLRLPLSDVPRLLALLLGLLVCKAAVAAALCLAFRLPLPTALRVGLLLAQGGEFAFVSLSLAAASSLVPEAIVRDLLLAIGLSMAATPPLMLLAGAVDRLLVTPVPGLRPGDLPAETRDLAQHVLIAGFGRVGQTVGRLLAARGMPWVAVDLDPARVVESRSRGLPVFFGDASRSDVLCAVGIDRARVAVITLDNPKAAVRAVQDLRRGLPELRIFVRARDRSHGNELTRSGASGVVPETVEASLQLAGRVLRACDLPPQEVERLIEHYRAEDYAGLDDVILAASTLPDRQARASGG